MNNKPLVSIIMPAYNAEKTIKESIESVLTQTYQNWELLIVNDGSKDNTSSVVSSYDDVRIKLIEQVNGGVANARNNGLQKAQGEYIAFLDSDDLWTIDKLEKQINYFQENIEVGLVYTDRKCFFENVDKAFDCEYKESIDIDDNYLRLLIYDYIATLTVMIKREVIVNVGLFDKELFGTEDWDLWIRIAKKYKIGHLKERLAYYREHDGGISKNFDRHSVEERKVIEKHVLNNSIEKKVINLSLWVWYKKSLIHSLKQLKIINALNFFVKMFLLRPFSIQNIFFIFQYIRFKLK